MADFDPADAYVDGFEHGYLTFDNSGTGYEGSYSAQVGTNSIVSATKRTGSYSLKIDTTGAARSVVTQELSQAVRFSVRAYILFDSLPTTDMCIIALRSPSGTLHHAGVRFNSADNKLKAFLRNAAGTYSDGTAANVTISTGTWYRVEFLVTQDTAPNPDAWTCDMRVDGTDGGQATNTGTATQLSVFYFGQSAAENLSTSVYYIDDLVVYSASTYTDNTAAPYPIGAGKVVGISVVSEGTHSTAASFTDDAGNSAPASFYDRIDEIPFAGTDTNYVYQDTIGANDYLEAIFGTLSDFGTMQGMSLWVLHNESTSGAANVRYEIYDPESGNTAAFADTHSSTSATFDVGLRRLVASTLRGTGSAGAFSQADVNDLRFRYGKSSDVTPFIRCYSVLLQVAYTEAAGDNDGWGWGQGTERWHYV